MKHALLASGLGRVERPQAASKALEVVIPHEVRDLQLGEERGRRIEIRSEWSDVFRELCPRRGALVLLRANRDGSAADSRIDGCLAI